ncbi:M6 family metalloprotease domain-containing protein [Gimesia panareensis]|uniref:M6 family metalloprotease domain-containing protein n=1 Tax=Gimesia panareensis TaxID=2527978 RepID=UPI001187DC46|nr:M6 family metalloprotease domain-containing protein [Gimesia panareensis]QDU50880.1 Immune inhibitor A precursor [Gimesia panareensis]
MKLKRHFCNPAVPCLVPPDPTLMQRLWGRFRELQNQKRIPEKWEFRDYFSYWLSRRRGRSVPGIDDGLIAEVKDKQFEEIEKISRPMKKLSGTIKTIVLLVDFEDQPHATENTQGIFSEMLFGSLPSGSMTEYYWEVSNSIVEIEGEVHGWFRMPRPMSYYTNGGSGTLTTFPRNSQGLARDAVKIALEEGVSFADYDAFGEKIVTALFIIHAGRGAEQTGSPYDIWSHKWQIPDGGVIVNKTPKIVAQTYLTVPEDCQVGVCSHEWGHLAARWADYYDTGETGKSQGLGMYCLMAAGSWGEGGKSPTYPNGMLRSFHDWVDVQVVDDTAEVELKPASEGGGVVIIQNSATMTNSQYVICEFRKKTNMDRALPDEGLAVFVVDESIENVNNEDHLAIELIQADGKRHLAKSGHFGNTGDENDLFPHKNKEGKIERTIGKTTRARINLPDGTWSGITIKVLGSPSDDFLKLKIDIDN